MCIKIPTTPESVVACNYLEKLGIRTLATCLFSVPQALAAHQAGCLYIAPYFNGTPVLPARAPCLCFPGGGSPAPGTWRAGHMC